MIGTASISPRTVAIVPAAGQSSRFGGMKLLAVIEGEPLLQHTLRSLLNGGVDAVVVVVARGATFSLVPLLSDPRVRVVVNEDPDRGMFSSIQTGLATLAPPVGFIVVLPADMPFVSAATVVTVTSAAAEAADRVVIPVHAGRRGHPIVMPGSLREVLLRADPARSLKDALLTTGVASITVPIDDPGTLRDVDVKQDLQR